MTETIIYASLASAFFAGMIALFAPCCITYLLPAYLGNIFKERRKIFFMTLVFSLGIFVVMLPAVLGVQAISSFVFRYHNQIYLTGGAVMVLVGFLALLGIKLPMIHLGQRKTAGRTDVFSIFTLGVVSGITTACCAPVLAGVLTLSFIAPSFWLAILVGAFYVLGMVSPLYVMSYFLDRRKVLTGESLKKPLGELSLLGRRFTVLSGNLISFLIFSGMGVLVLYLTMATDFSMAGGANLIQNTVVKLQEFFQQIPFADAFLGALLLGVLGFLVIKGLRSPEK